MHCRQPSLNVRYGTGYVRDRYGTGTGQVRDRYGTGTVEGNTTPSTALMTAKKEKGCYKFFNSPIFFRHYLGFEPALSPHMHSPIHFAFILILPSCFTL